MASGGMKYIHSDLGQLKRGDVVEVTLTRAANVILLDSANFGRFKRGQKHTYFGGLAKRSPAKIQVPRSGRWTAVVHMQGLRGSTRASFRVIPLEAMRPLPEIRTQKTPVETVAANLIEAAGTDEYDSREFDVFVSYASEDRNTIAAPLAHELVDHGLSVWFDEFELKVGDSLRRKIDAGIGRSRFGVVVLSQSFFAKGWPEYELDGLVTMAVSGKQVLLPVWHEVTHAEVREYSPSLADRVALKTSDHDIASIAGEIASVIPPASS